jgi:hypothetical protein
MDYNMTLLLLVLVGLITYILFTPDNWFTKTLDKYCCDNEPTIEDLPIKVMIPKEIPAPPKKKRDSKRKKKAEATESTKPKKKRKYTRRKKNGVK